MVESQIELIIKRNKQVVSGSKIIRPAGLLEKCTSEFLMKSTMVIICRLQLLADMQIHEEKVGSIS